MNDHVHVVAEPNSGYRLTTIIHSWKSYTARYLQAGNGRKGSIWQDEYFDRIIRDEAELVAKLEYIRTNPEKRWPGVGVYAWMWTYEGDSAEEPGAG
jgi:putative DNA methylase